jgi:CelD/BcsL family acetyltransferase involved in cellulose biosynthesis
MPHVVEFRSLEALEPYRLAWRNLWRKTRGATPAQTFDWYRAFTLHGDVEPRALVVCDDESAPIGIVPLVTRREPHRAGATRMLAYPVAADSGFCGPVTTQPTLVMLEAVRHLATSADWDALDLAGIDVDRHDHGRTASAFYHAELPVRIASSGRRAIVELDGSWNDYWRSRGDAFVRRLDRAAHALDRRGLVEHVRHRPEGAMCDDDDPRWDLYGDAMLISLGGWESDEATTLCSPGRIDLFRALHAAAARTGTLDLNLLYIEGRPVAFSYNYVVDGVVTVAATGRDPEFADTGVDAVLTRAMLRDSCSLGDREVVLGDLPAANPWATRLIDSYRARYERRTPLVRRLLAWGRRHVPHARERSS